MSVLDVSAAALPLAQPHRVSEAETAFRQDTAEVQGVPFADELRDMLKTHEAHAWSARRAEDSFAGGSLDDIHGTMIALKEADIELRVIANVRNKLLDAFNDLLRMSV